MTVTKRGIQRSRLLLPVLALSASTAVLAQPEPQAGPAPSDGDGSQEIIQLTGRQVPVAIRAESLFEGLAYLQKADQAEGTSKTSAFLKTYGLDPDSQGARELCEIAVAIEESVAAYDMDAFRVLDDRALAAAQENSRLLSSRLAGEGLGTWLRNREIEGLALDPLLRRLLDSPYMSTTLTSTDGPVFFSDLEDEVEEFERGMIRTLGYLPGMVSQGVGEREQR